jgi:tetratricopeptide (TPR) repeat protein
MRWLAYLGPCLLLVLLSLLLYLGTLSNTRLATENQLIWAHPGIAGGETGVALEGRWQSGEYRPQVRPVPVLVRVAEHSFFDFNRGSYQTVQILLHGIVAALVFILLARLFASPILGALGGLLFLVHPGASHSVMYLGGLSEILCVLFFFGALLALDRVKKRQTTGGFVLIGVLSLLAMLSKEIGFLLPLVALAYLLASRIGRRGLSAAILPVLVATVVAVVYRVVAIGSMDEIFRRIPAVDPTSGLPLYPLIAQSLSGIAVEASVILLPLRLSHDYSWLLVLGGLPLVFLFVVALAFIAGAVWVAVHRGGTPLRTSLATLAILPLITPAVIPHLQGTVASERNLYLALAGWVGLLLLLGRWLANRRVLARPILVGLGVLIILLLGLRTGARVGDFESQDRLLQASIESYPMNPYVLFELGNRQLSRSQFTDAVEKYEEALALRPDFPLASVNLGAAYIAMEEWGLALRALDPAAAQSKHVRALRMVDAKAHYHAGLVLIQQRRDREAALAFERTLLFYPDHLGALANLGLMYIGAPEYVERGIEILEQVIPREQNDVRRTQLRAKIEKAEELLDGFIEDQGGFPSEVGRSDRGAIGRPWEEVAEEGM